MALIEIEDKIRSLSFALNVPLFRQIKNSYNIFQRSVNINIFNRRISLTDTEKINLYNTGIYAGDNKGNTYKVTLNNFIQEKNIITPKKQTILNILKKRMKPDLIKIKILQNTQETNNTIQNIIDDREKLLIMNRELKTSPTSQRWSLINPPNNIIMGNNWLLEGGMHEMMTWFNTNSRVIKSTPKKYEEYFATELAKYVRTVIDFNSNVIITPTFNLTKSAFDKLMTRKFPRNTAQAKLLLSKEAKAQKVADIKEDITMFHINRYEGQKIDDYVIYKLGGTGYEDVGIFYYKNNKLIFNTLFDVKAKEKKIGSSNFITPKPLLLHIKKPLWYVGAISVNIGNTDEIWTMCNMRQFVFNELSSRKNISYQPSSNNFAGSWNDIKIIGNSGNNITNEHKYKFRILQALNFLTYVSHYFNLSRRITWLN